VGLAGLIRAVVEDDCGSFVIAFVGDGGKGAEQEVGDVCEDGGATRGEAVLGKEDEQSGKDLIDVVGGLEGGKFADELAG